MEKHPQQTHLKNNESVIDPSKSSFIEGVLNLKKEDPIETPSIFNGPDSKRTVYRDKHTGEEFFLIDPAKRPEFQRLISYIVKGVINVADIVEHDGQYFSHKQQLKNVEVGNDFFQEEITADAFILKNIFGDDDHISYRKESSRFKFFRTKRNLSESILLDDIEHRNIVINEKNKNHYIFDLDQAGYIGIGEKGNGFHSLQLQTDQDKLDYKKYLIDAIYSPADPYEKYKIITIKILKNKIDLLIKNIFSEEHYNVFLKIVEKSGTHFEEKTFDFYSFDSEEEDARVKEIFNDLCMRCIIMRDLLEKILQAQQS